MAIHVNKPSWGITMSKINDEMSPRNVFNLCMGYKICKKCLEINVIIRVY